MFNDICRMTATGEDDVITYYWQEEGFHELIRRIGYSKAYSLETPQPHSLLSLACETNKSSQLFFPLRFLRENLSGLTTPSYTTQPLSLADSASDHEVKKKTSAANGEICQLLQRPSGFTQARARIKGKRGAAGVSPFVAEQGEVLQR